MAKEEDRRKEYARAKDRDALFLPGLTNMTAKISGKMTTKEADRIFLQTFSFSFLCLCIFIIFRGFGWDGDSFMSACQFIKIINPNIFGMGNSDTSCKLMSIVTFGLFYKIFGNFYMLTVLSITINSLMCALICKWVFENGGRWFITIIGLMANVLFLSMVIICDNSAFSPPFIFFGLYLYFHKNRKFIGSLLVFIASLFRPGPEVILLLIIFIELFRKQMNIRLLSFTFFLFLVAIIHTAWGYRLGYPTFEDYFAKTVLCWKTPDLTGRYWHSPAAILPYLKSILFQLTRPSAFPFFVLALFGFARLVKVPNDIKFSGLSVFASYLCPVGYFLYGNVGVSSSYHMEFPFCYAIFAAFFCYKSAFDQNVLSRLKYKPFFKITAILALIVFIIYKGIDLHGVYEINPDGSGALKYKSIPEVRSLAKEIQGLRAAVMSRDCVFFILDAGVKLKKLTTLYSDQDVGKLRFDDYDVILLSKDAEKYCDKNIYAIFRRIDIDGSRALFLRVE